MGFSLKQYKNQSDSNVALKEESNGVPAIPQSNQSQGENNALNSLTDEQRELIQAMALQVAQQVRLPDVYVNPPPVMMNEIKKKSGMGFIGIGLSSIGVAAILYVALAVYLDAGMGGVGTAVQAQLKGGAQSFMPKALLSKNAIPNRFPIEGMTVKNITSDFRTLHRPNHHGIDVAIKSGTNLYTVARGSVVKSGNLGNSCGRGIKIAHDQQYYSIFCHCSTVLKDEGDKVEDGDVVCLSGGGEGDWRDGKSTGPHMHLSIKQGASNCNHKECAVDPKKMLTNPATPLEDALKPGFFSELGSKMMSWF